MIEIVFLGTSASVPTRERGLPCIVIRRKGELLMFDCGEGSQRAFLQSGLGLNKPLKVFISHMHGDHVLGLPGLLSSMSLLGRTNKVDIYGPPGIREFLERIFELVPATINYEIRVHEILHEGVVCETEEYIVRVAKGHHPVVNFIYALEERERPGKFYPEKAEALGVPKGPLCGLLQRGHEIRLPDGRIIKPEDVMGPPRPGLKVVYTGDTSPCEELIEISRGADLLIHESTYLDNLRARALKEGHSTAKLAAEDALRAGVRMLVLTHISARYSGVEKLLLDEARKVFENTELAFDGMRITLKE